MPRDLQKVLDKFPKEDHHVIEYLLGIKSSIITEMELHFETGVRSIKVLSKILNALKDEGFFVQRLFKVTNKDGEHFYVESLFSLSEQEQDDVTEIATTWSFL